MAPFRPNNLNRAAYRAKCRNKLSEHILAKLGISIEPAEVRLIPCADDPYTWKILPEKEHLFKKQLSKHSIGAYRELCRGVGASFEAIQVPGSSHAAEDQLRENSGGDPNLSSPEISFSTVIEQLKREKLTIATEMEGLYDQVIKATELKQLAKEEAVRSQVMIQAVEINRQILQQEMQNLTAMVEYFRHTTANSVYEVLTRLKLDLSLFGGGQ